MANVNIRTPRFFVDYPNYLMSRGVSNDEFYVVATDASAYKMGTVDKSAIELFDMKPLNQVTFSTSTDTDGHVLIIIDLNTTGFYTDFVAILNHNMYNADAKVRIATSDTENDVRAVDYASADTTPTLIEVTGCDAVSGAVATPSVTGTDNDGHMIVRFSESTDQFIGIQFEGTVSQTNVGAANGTFDSSTNLSVGCILVGQYFDMPISPDLSVKRSIDFDAVNMQESLGGQRYSTMTNHGRNATSSQNKSPFQTYYHNLGVYGGRMSYDMKFSYMNSDKIMPSAYNVVQGASETVIEDLWNKTNGRHIPFIFTQDSSSTSESDYMFARFAQDNLGMTQVAPDVFDVSMKIEEEF